MKRYRWVLPLLAILVIGCEQATDPLQVSYIAMVTLVDDPSTIGTTARIDYRVTELSGTIAFDKVYHVSPFDTVIVQVEPATYSVVLAGIPSYCRLRYGDRQDLYVAPGTNTTIARYFATCTPPLTIHTFTEGLDLDPEYVYRITPAGGGERVGLIGGTDTVSFDTLPAGAYTIELSHVSANCDVVSDQGSKQQVLVDSLGGTEAQFRINCSDPAKRPTLVSVAGSYHDSAAAFVFRATDPNRDIERYYWDLTNCQGRSLLSGGARLRRGLSLGRTAGLDTVTVVAAFEVGLPADSLQGRCVSIRVADEFGNSTPVIERALGGSGTAPAAVDFNAVLLGSTALHTSLTATDPDGDFIGLFPEARLRDGVLGPSDGSPDLGIYSVAGYLDTAIPDVPLGGRIQYYDVYAVIVYLVDAQGNFTRLEDSNVFQ
jgi:hypothetical protein